MSFLTTVPNYKHTQNDNCWLVLQQRLKTANLHMAAKYFAMLNSRALELLSFTVQLVEHRTVIAGSWIRFPLKTRNFYGAFFATSQRQSGSRSLVIFIRSHVHRYDLFHINIISLKQICLSLFSVINTRDVGRIQGKVENHELICFCKINTQQIRQLLILL